MKNIKKFIWDHKKVIGIGLGISGVFGLALCSYKRGYKYGYRYGYRYGVDDANEFIQRFLIDYGKKDILDEIVKLMMGSMEKDKSQKLHIT